MPLHNEAIYNRLKARLGINPLALDDELMGMPQLVIDVGEQLADCLSARDIAANELKVAAAEAAARLRNIPVVSENAKGDTVEKTRSEAQIDSELPMQKPVKQATLVLEDAKYDVAMWQTLMDAARTKSMSLHKVAELTLAGYMTPDAAYHTQRAKLTEKRNQRATLKDV